MKKRSMYIILIISSMIGIGTSLTLISIVHDTEAYDLTPQSENSARKIFDSCKSDIHCPVEKLTDMTKRETSQIVLTTFSHLVTLYDADDDSCHKMAHHLGMWLYGYTHDLEESLSYARQQCGGAVFHGILQSYFMTQELHNTDPAKIIISDLCPADQNNPYSIIRWQCLHGIGHGLTEFYNYDVVNAVTRCDELKPGWEQISCSKGVFMENVVHYYETGKGDFNKSDIFFPCNKINQKYAPACYDYYHLSYILKDDDILEVNQTFGECDKISPVILIKYCYYGMGRQLSSTAHHNAKEGLTYCSIGKQSQYHSDCMRGMLLTLVNGDTNTDEGFEFCSNSEKNFKDQCYDSLGKWIRMLYPSNQERQIECTKAENYSNICMNATLDNIQLL